MSVEKVTPITIESAALDDYNGHIILRGVISLVSLGHLLVDEYQREELTVGQRASIFEALELGESLPDVELGMRGQRYRETESGNVMLRDPVYIIDGYQRVRTILTHLEKDPSARIRLGAKIYFDTTKEWESRRFEVLNAKRIKVAPAVLLRNLREGSSGTQMLWNLTKVERTFVMYDRVCWTQNMARGELITAGMFGKHAAVLHAHKSVVGAGGGMSGLSKALDRTVEVVGIQNMRENLRVFWGLVDECWGIQRVHHKGTACYLKGTFLTVLAKLLSDHYDFWETDMNERKLFVHAPLRRKLAQFQVNDPEVVRLAGAGGKAADILYHLMRDHINSGKRTKKIRSRHGDAVILGNQPDDDESEAA